MGGGGGANRMSKRKNQNVDIHQSFRMGRQVWMKIIYVDTASDTHTKTHSTQDMTTTHTPAQDTTQAAVEKRIHLWVAPTTAIGSSTLQETATAHTTKFLARVG